MTNKENEPEGHLTYFTKREMDRLRGFARMTDLLYRLPRQLAGREQLPVPSASDATKVAFYVTADHIPIIAKTAHHLYESELSQTPHLKDAALGVIQQTQAIYDAKRDAEVDQLNTLWEKNY